MILLIMSILAFLKTGKTFRQEGNFCQRNQWDEFLDKKGRLSVKFFYLCFSDVTKTDKRE